MRHFSGYQATELLFEDARFHLWRGFRELDGEKVLIKSLRLNRPGLLDQAALKSEFRITGKLPFKDILKPLAVDPATGALMLEYFSGRPLDVYGFFRDHGLEGFLHVAMKLVTALLEAHQHNVIHQNLRPLHMLYDPQTREVRLYGFAVSSLKDAGIDEERLQGLLGVLAYMAPEQTGRLNRRVGMATDLYSLGVSFYELLSGLKPFEGSDPLTLVHSHLARPPRDLRALNEQVPQVLAEMIMKLLNKNPEDRYRSLFGFARDLKRCRALFEKNGEVPHFEVGTEDVSHQFALPGRLYGRKLEMETADKALVRVCRGEARLLLVSGPSGVGKTALIDELRRSTAGRKRYFVKGICERKSRDIPYKPFIDAFHDLVHQVLSEAPAELAQWRIRILQALGPLARALTDVVPDLELIIGQQPHLPELEITEAKNRFQVALLKFIATFACKKHALVIFIDDLHWMGTSTRELITALLNEPQMGYLFLVGAVREGVADPVISELTAAVPCDHITLGSIDLLEIQELLWDALGVVPDENRSLAELVLSRTGGNPLHARFYLQSLYDKGLLAFVARSGTWNWDAALISVQRPSDDDMRKLIGDKTVHLSKQTLRLLQLASCIGTRFELKRLALAAESSQSETAVILASALEAGLIVPLGESYLLIDMVEEHELDDLADSHAQITYEFVHGRVQQAIYETMTSRQSKATHLRVGQLLLRHSRNAHKKVFVFRVVNQLNLGRELIKEEKERLELANLNLEAGRRARETAAYSDALSYFRIAASMLAKDAAEHSRELWFNIHLQLAEMAYFNDCIDEAEALFALLLAKTKAKADQALVYETRVLIFINISRLERAVTVGLEGLAMFGIVIPEQALPMKAEIARHMETVEQWLTTHPPDEILALSENDDEASEHVVNLLMQITPPAFNTNQDLFKLTTLLQVEQVIEHGHNRLSAYAIASLGILLGMQGDYQRGYALSRLALEVNGRFPDALVRNRLLFIGCNLVNHWWRPLREDLPILTQIQRYFEDHGDLVYANYSLLVLAHHRWFLGESLLKLLDDTEQSIHFATLTHNEAARHTHRFLVQAILNLRGLTLQPDTFNAADFDSEACLTAIGETAYFTGQIICRILQLEVFFLRGAYTRCKVVLASCRPILHFADNLVMQVLFYFYQGLLLCRREEDRETSAEEKAQLQSIETRFQTWSRQVPDHFEAMYQLIRAERARLEKDDMNAMRFYQLAIRHAGAQSLKKLEAVGHELAGSFFLDRAFYAYAGHHFRGAISAYDFWGATAKAADLRQKYGAIIQEGVRRDETGRGLGGSESLDKITLLKAAQAIAGEIHIHRLLPKMMRFVVENAGAQRGVFIHNNKGRLMVGAEWRLNQEEGGVVEEVSLNACDDLASSVIHYVFRTRGDLVIADVGGNEQFVNDPYLQKSRVKSLLCMPVLRQTELLGMLYLENHLARDTFTPERLEMLRLLTPQIAVSLENARFIANMAALNETLTSEISERKKAEHALRKAQEIAIANAHQAGKAEFASSVLHNINNVLNSVGMSAETMAHLVRTSKLANLSRAMEMIQAHLDDLPAFFNTDKRGRLLPGYLIDLTEVLSEEHGILGEELESLRRHIRLMVDIIQTQQKHAKGAMSGEHVDLILLCEDALEIQKQALERHEVELIRNYQMEAPVLANRAELTHILINLVKNAVEAMGFSERRQLKLTIGKNDRDQPYLEVADTGVGITEENMAKMFTHGFTTKAEGHGFGLHYCRQAMSEMGGEIQVHSEGKNKGTRFLLTFAAG